MTSLPERVVENEIVRHHTLSDDRSVVVLMPRINFHPIFSNARVLHPCIFSETCMGGAGGGGVEKGFTRGCRRSNEGVLRERRYCKAGTSYDFLRCCFEGCMQLRERSFGICFEPLLRDGMGGHGRLPWDSHVW
jgi:hypothetical protein